jgi:hypothetical protein
MGNKWMCVMMRSKEYSVGPYGCANVQETDEQGNVATDKEMTVAFENYSGGFARLHNFVANQGIFAIFGHQVRSYSSCFGHLHPTNGTFPVRGTSVTTHLLQVPNESIS